LLIRGACAKAFKDELKRFRRAIRGVFISGANPQSVVIPTTRLHNGQSLSIHESAIDVGFLELYGFKPLAGVSFSRA